MRRKILTTRIALSLALLIFLAAPASYGEAEISVESTVDQSQITIGDVIQYTVLVHHDSSIQVESPAMAVNLGQFQIRDYQSHDPETDGAMVTERTDYWISTYDTGEYTIPSLQIDYRLGSDTTRYHIESEPIDIVVESLNPDKDGDIRDIKPVRTPPRDWTPYFIWGAIVLVSLILAILVFVFVRRRQRGEALFPAFQKPPRPLHERILEALQDLSHSSYLEQGDIKGYYTRLSEIVRDYITERYSLNAHEMTTRQLIIAMQQNDVAERPTERVRRILSLCDLVKFAKFIPDDSEQHQMLQEAIEFVQETKLDFSDADQSDDEHVTAEKNVEED
jgi:hypothetical protein